MQIALTSRMSDSTLGNAGISLVLDFICLFRFSSMLLVLRNWRTAAGNENTVRPSGMLSSIHAASFDWHLEYFSTMLARRRLASSRLPAWNIDLMSAATSAFRPDFVT